ncbi:hypothetical protein J4754_29160 [Burkholderia pseudomallei]|nr:hypothetical protein [Burkholderia pseudomallei]
MHVRRSSVAAHCNEVRCPAASPRGAMRSSASGVRAAAARAGAPAWLDEHRIALGMHAEATHAPPLSSARALRRPDESRPVRLDDRVVARLSRAVDCVRCAVVRACVVVVVARADARPARASARHRVRMRPFAPRPFAPYALPAHGAPMHAFGARRSQTPCICSAGADEAAARKRARPESHARAFASIRFITPANPWTNPILSRPTHTPTRASPAVAFVRMHRPPRARGVRRLLRRLLRRQLVVALDGRARGVACVRRAGSRRRCLPPRLHVFVLAYGAAVLAHVRILASFILLAQSRMSFSSNLFLIRNANADSLYIFRSRIFACRLRDGAVRRAEQR